MHCESFSNVYELLLSLGRIDLWRKTLGMIHCNEIVQVVLFKYILIIEVKVKILTNLQILSYMFGVIG